MVGGGTLPLTIFKDFANLKKIYVLRGSQKCLPRRDGDRPPDGLEGDGEGPGHQTTTFLNGRGAVATATVSASMRTSYSSARPSGKLR